MSELLPISLCRPDSSVGDVLFVHGLGGSPIATWSSDSKNPTNYWPAWLSDQRQDLSVWSLGYDASAFAWQGSPMPLFDRATNALALVDIEGIGRRPIVFIAHSLGGLLVKQMIQNGLTLGNARWHRIAENTKGLVFLATPHHGSNLANFMTFLSRLLTAVTLRDLQSGSDQLRALNEWYRNHAFNRYKTEVYCEKKKTGWKGLGVIVVDDYSANPGIAGVTPIPLDEDHLSICKPVSRDSLVCKRVLRLVEECIPPVPPNPDRVTSAPTSPQGVAYLTRTKLGFGVAYSLSDRERITPSILLSLKTSLRKEFRWPKARIRNAILVLRELEANAFEHGCRGSDEHAVRIRGTMLEPGDAAEHLKLCVQSPGDGFDLAAILHAAEHLPIDAPRGRGLALCSKLADSLFSTSNGREIHATVAKRDYVKKIYDKHMREVQVVKLDEVGDIAIVPLIGDFAHRYEIVAIKLVFDAVSVRAMAVIVDLKRAEHLGSAVLTALLAIYRRLKTDKKRMYFINIGDTAALFQLTALDTLFAIFDSLEAAKVAIVKDTKSIDGNITTEQMSG